MNLIFGKRCPETPGKAQLREIYNRIMDTIDGEPLAVNVVPDACEQVLRRLEEPEAVAELVRAGMSETDFKAQISQVKAQFGRERLYDRLVRELADGFGEKGVRKDWLPLGTLLHISAGNAYGLAAFSVLEGLLTGNVNLLKLPGVGDEVSLLLLEWLIEAEPVLADYIYVFGFSSDDVKLLTTLARMADAAVVWGGDEAVQAVRRLAPANLRLIEWGHKISFAYMEPAAAERETMLEIARHMCETGQLYCNSCQGIYLDTDDFGEVRRLAGEYAAVLAEVSGDRFAAALSEGVKAQLTLKLRSREIEAIQQPDQYRLFRCGDISVWADRGPQPEASYLFGNCWVKPLPKEKIVRALRPAKSYLQTAALYCETERRAEYEERLLRAGVCRVTTAAALGGVDFALPHDGEYALRKYCRMGVRR